MKDHKLHSDATTNNDSLHRQAFAEGIARTLVHSMPIQNESVVFGLNGRWGSGKSTLLRFVVEEIKKLHSESQGDRFEIFQFNPWMYSGQEQLLWSFYRSLLKLINKPDSKLKKQANAIVNWLDDSKLGKLMDAMPGTGDYTGKIKKGLQHLLGEGDLEDIREKLNEALVKDGIRLYIIMDDLDRLTPDEITQVFQLVKMSANFKNTVFLLAYDKEVVVNAVEQKFKDNGERYLAKIVQVDYTLPEMLAEDIERIFFEQLVKFFASFNIPFEKEEMDTLRRYWKKFGLKDYFLTLRDVYRYTNGLAFRFPLIWENVNVVHFLLLEAIRVFDHAGYQNVYSTCLNMLRKNGNFPSFNASDEWLKTIIKNPTSIELIGRIQGAYKPRLIGESLPVSKDLFSHDAFERYYSMRMLNTDLSEKDFIAFLDNQDQLPTQLIRINQSGRLGNLLRRLATGGWEERFLNRGSEVVPAMMNFFDTLAHNERTHYLPLLLDVIGHIKTVNQENPKGMGVIEGALFEPGSSYPQVTRFMLLYWMWDERQHPNDGTEDKEQRKIIRNLKDYAKAWKDSVARDIPYNIRDAAFFKVMLETVAKFEPLDYGSFVKEKLGRTGQIIWVVEQCITFSDDGHPRHWRGGKSPMFTSEVFDFFREKLGQLLPTELDELTQRQLEVRKFFLEIV